MNPKTYSQSDTLLRFKTSVQVPDRLNNPQPCMNSSVSIFLMGDRITKVDQETIAKILSYMTIITLDDFRTGSLIFTYYVPVVFGVEL
jgi:hypothetical protein